MNDTIRTQSAGRDDIWGIAVFLDACWKSEYRGIVSDDHLDSMLVDERYNGLLERFDENASDFLTMTDKNRIIGAAVFGKSFTDGYEDDGEIAAIYLHKDYIGKGYGHSLFVKIEQILRGKGYTNFILDVLEGNARAIQFYLTHGYKNVDNRIIRLGEKDYPLVVMRKEA